MDCSLPGSSVPGILQARILEWVAISFFKEIFPTQGWNPGLPHCRQMLYHLSHQGSLSLKIMNSNYYTQQYIKHQVLTQSFLTLRDPMDCSPPGSSVHGTSQARILEWVAISFSRGFSQHRDPTGSPALQADSLASDPTEKSLGTKEHIALAKSFGSSWK